MKKNKNDFVFLTIVSLLFFTINRINLDSWYYSAIGDEYAFFNFAQEIALGRKVNLFSQNGVYGIIPTLSSIYQAGVMKVFGINNVGWKTSMILVVIFSFFPFYFLAKDLFSQKVAKFSLLVLASSHYLWAYVHAGYSNIEALFPTVASLFFLRRGLKNKDWPSLLCSGIFAGLGFYTFYSSRVAIFILLSVVIFLKKRQSFPAILAIVCGFLLLFSPFILTNKNAVVEAMLKESLLVSNEARSVSRSMLLLQNIPRSFFAFNFNHQAGPYVSGSLLDPISGFLFLLGFIVALINFRKQSFAIMLIWFLWGFLTTGVFSEFSYVPISRLNFLLPVVAIFAGITLDYLTKKLGKLLLLLIIFLIFVLNSFRFFYQTPRILQATNEAVAIKAFREICFEQKTAIIDENPFPLLKPALSSYNLINSPALFQAEKIGVKTLSSYSCLILTRPDSSMTKQLVKEIEKHFPSLTQSRVSDWTLKTTAIVYYQKK